MVPAVIVIVVMFDVTVEHSGALIEHLSCFPLFAVKEGSMTIVCNVSPEMSENDPPLNCH